MYRKERYRLTVFKVLYKRIHLNIIYCYYSRGKYFPISKGPVSISMEAFILRVCNSTLNCAVSWNVVYKVSVSLPFFSTFGITKLLFFFAHVDINLKQKSVIANSFKFYSIWIRWYFLRNQGCQHWGACVNIFLWFCFMSVFWSNIMCRWML